jgi:4-hydroxybenzoate polyprenyltransferase
MTHGGSALLEEKAIHSLAFVHALASQIYLYVAYGAGAVVLAFWGYFTGRIPPVWLWLVVSAFGFLLGAFKSWRAKSESIETLSRANSTRFGSNS